MSCQRLSQDLLAPVQLLLNWKWQKGGGKLTCGAGLAARSCGSSKSGGASLPTEPRCAAGPGLTA